MSYQSVDKLQNALGETVFSYAKDRKKAAGRALGTLVEIITFYTLRSWGFRDSVAIERALPEYKNDQITHNVEYSIHPIIEQSKHTIAPVSMPITGAKMRKAIWPKDRAESENDKNTRLLTADYILRNSCIITETVIGPYVVHLDTITKDQCGLSLSLLHRKPFAIFECKRVGVEEGMAKGPQTIEKAKHAENHNKELKVLAQSYDWLIFLTDAGLSEFISELLLHPKEELLPARKAFLESYKAVKTGTRFTKHE